MGVTGLERPPQNPKETPLSTGEGPQNGPPAAISTAEVLAALQNMPAADRQAIVDALAGPMVVDHVDGQGLR